MRKDFGSKAWMYPLPVLIIGTYDEDGKPNAMNAAWGGIYNDDLFYLCLSRNHKTTENILKNRAFTVSFATQDQLVACDYVGIASGNKAPDKFAKAGFTAAKSSFVNAPVINELPVTLECELVSAEGENYVGRILNVSADESVLSDDGQIDYTKLKPITYDPVRHHYVPPGARVGAAYYDGKALM